MERLTRKSLEYKDTWIADGLLSNIEGVVRGKAIDKLAEIEDFMQEQGFESLEELKAFVIYAKQNEEPFITIDGDLLKKNLKDSLDKYYRRG